jgi:hypothetical protein
VYREFLQKTYLKNSHKKKNDETTIMSYCILDVAGGKGDLSWLLINADGAKSVVVDPRALSSCSHLIRSVRWLEDHPKEAQERAIPDRPTHQPLAALVPQILERKQRQGQDAKSSGSIDEYDEPQHLQLKLDNAVVDALRESRKEEEYAVVVGDQECPRTWQFFWEQQGQFENTTGSGGASTCFLPESERARTTNPPIRSALEAWKIFQSIRLIAGFHPDQATEACIDLADVLQVPVCIVPCCVFPSELPDRRLIVEKPLDATCWNANHEKGGSSSTVMMKVRVRDYESFLQYLQQKQPKLRNETLAFHQSETSRNVVLYTLPEDILQG